MRALSDAFDAAMSRARDGAPPRPAERQQQVLNIEPATRDENGFLYHTEDTLVITDGEPCLTDLMDTDELFVIG